jgi:DeoR family deoxyribose operon repressor
MGRKQDRMARIVQTLRTRSAASIHELAKDFGVSDITIRRDLNHLAVEKVVRFVHSGAVLNTEAVPAETPRYSLAEAGGVRAEEKLRIGRKAASLVEDNDVIIIDSGSTAEYLARSIPADRHLTIVCFALNILVEVRRKEACRIIFSGGNLHENTLMFESTEGVELVRGCRASKAFVTAYGVSEKLGVTCANPYEVEMKRAAIDTSLTRILVADSSKFGKIYPAWFADLHDIQVVVTDLGLPQIYRDILTKQGIVVHLV